jgi:hypothetical protein
VPIPAPRSSAARKQHAIKKPKGDHVKHQVGRDWAGSTGQRNELGGSTRISSIDQGSCGWQSI